MSIPIMPDDKWASVRRMQDRIKKRKADYKNADKRGVCGFCKSAYRDDFGNVQCGMAFLGVGHVIKKPFEEGCKAWKPRENYQPQVFEQAARNVDFAKKVRLVDMVARWGGTPKGF